MPPYARFFASTGNNHSRTVRGTLDGRGLSRGPPGLFTRVVSPIRQHARLRLTDTSERDWFCMIAGVGVSGRYRAKAAGFEVELRVDVDGPRATKRVSADYFRIAAGPSVGGRASGADAPEYIGSMRMDAPSISLAGERVTIEGSALFSWPTENSYVKVSIASTTPGSPPAQAMLAHFAADGTAAARYLCGFESEYFRSVYFEEAHEKFVEQLVSYDTASLSSEGPVRILSPVAAYGEAGIEMLESRASTVIDSGLAGADAAWSDAELNAAMEVSFSRWADRPQWAIWLLHAFTHENPDIFGLMFDRQGLQRQGCAVFYQGLDPADPVSGRDLLHACVHELGHGFNLLHCWQRSLDKPPLPSRPDAETWMNYPSRYPEGPDEFWARFRFRFDDVELVQLRHGFRDTVIMGGAPFAGSPASGLLPWDAEEQDGGLRLVLQTPSAVALGVPITVGLQLTATTDVGRDVPAALGPRPMTIAVAIRDPRGREFVYRPLLRHCRGDTVVRLRAGDEPLQDFAFVDFGDSGFSFATAGLYRMRARYEGPDGALALSQEALIRVRQPATPTERDVMALVSGDSGVGTLLSVVGSDAPHLLQANRTLALIVARYPRHPLAAIARVVLAANLARAFKVIGLDGSIVTRAPDLDRAAVLAASVIDGPATVALAARRPARPSIVTRSGVDPLVSAFVNSRRVELRALVATLAAHAAQIAARRRRRPRQMLLGEAASRAKS